MIKATTFPSIKCDLQLKLSKLFLIDFFSFSQNMSKQDFRPLTGFLRPPKHFIEFSRGQLRCCVCSRLCLLVLMCVVCICMQDLKNSQLLAGNTNRHKKRARSGGGFHRLSATRRQLLPVFSSCMTLLSWCAFPTL